MNPMDSKYWSDFTYWIQERERIRLAKEVYQEDPPWTDDPIMASVRFCNICREDDKVTKWIKQNWRDPLSEHGDIPLLVFGMCIARVINWPDTLQLIRLPIVPNWTIQRDFIEVLDWMQKKGLQIWGNAYMVTGGYSKGGETKQAIMGRVLASAQGVLYGNRVPYKLLDEVHQNVMDAPGLGSFLAAQVVADVKYTPQFITAPDWWSFCAPGPGSTMGLNFLYDRKPGEAIGHTRFMKEVNEIRSLLKEHYYTELTAHDVQNCLCEFSKYVRVKYLGMRAKRGYTASKTPGRTLPLPGV